MDIDTDTDTDVPTTANAPHAGGDGSFLPGFSRNWLLPLYDPVVRLLGMDRHHRQLLDLAELRPGERVLEIGCGTGNLSLLAGQRHPEVEMVGLDPDAAALARARRKAHRRGAAVQFVHGFAQRLPFDDGSFDRVVSAFMLHHLASDVKPAAMGEARRVLGRGGTLHVVDFGGAVRRSDGLAARMQLRQDLLADNLGTGIPELLWDAGFSDVGEIAHCVTRLGRITHCRAEVPARVGARGAGVTPSWRG